MYIVIYIYIYYNTHTHIYIYYNINIYYLYIYIYIYIMYMYIIPTISLFGVPQYIFQPKRSNPSASGKALQVDYDKLRHHPVLPRFFELPQWKVQAPSPLALSLLRCQVTGTGILTMGWWGVKREKRWFHQGKWGVFDETSDDFTRQKWDLNEQKYDLTIIKGI